jgi:hypothetical protein
LYPRWLSRRLFPPPDSAVAGAQSRISRIRAVGGLAQGGSIKRRYVQQVSRTAAVVIHDGTWFRSTLAKKSSASRYGVHRQAYTSIACNL